MTPPIEQNYTRPALIQINCRRAHACSLRYNRKRISSLRLVNIAQFRKSMASPEPKREF